MLDLAKKFLHPSLVIKKKEGNISEAETEQIFKLLKFQIL